MIEFIDEPGLIAPPKNMLGFEADIAITTFSPHTFAALIECTKATLVTEQSHCCNYEVFAFELAGKKVLVYRSPIGAPAAVATAEEIVSLGVKKLIAFGICGSLVSFHANEFIVPDNAFRDEGTSFHYMPPTDSIRVKNSAVVAELFRENGVSAKIGGTWSTDGFYRETRTRAGKMVGSGCIAVDMECSALQAFADFRGIDFYTFFITADSLAGEKWLPNNIGNLTVGAPTQTAATLAVRLAQKIR